MTSPADHITREDVPLPGKAQGYSAGMTLKEMLAEHENRILLQARQKHRTTRKIATALGISQASAARKLGRIKVRDDG